MNKMILKRELLSEYEQNSIKCEFVDEKYDRTCIEVKWDGCCDIRLHSNNSTYSNPNYDDVDYFHVCELKEFIDLLTQVYDEAVNRGYEV